MPPNKQPSERQILAEILAASEQEHQRHQAELAKRDAEELERARIESEAAQKLERARLSLLEQTEQAQLQLVLQHSLQTNTNNTNDHLALELALALSLEEHQEHNTDNPPSYENSINNTPPSPDNLTQSSSSRRPSSSFGRPLLSVPPPTTTTTHRSPSPANCHPCALAHSPIIIPTHHPHDEEDAADEEISDPFSDQFAAPLEEDSCEEQPYAHSQHSSLSLQESHHGLEEAGDNKPAQKVALMITMPSHDSDHHQDPPPTSAVSRLDTESFDANPSPPESVAEGIRYGQIHTIDQPLDSHGQCPDALVLSQYSPLSGKKSTKHPLLAIEAWTWTRLLTYLMWHGNTRIEPGPLDVSEASDSGLGGWEVGMSVVFKEQEGGITQVRLVLELVAGTGASQWSRTEGGGESSSGTTGTGGGRHRRRSSVMLGRLGSGEGGVGGGSGSNSGSGGTTIHLPRPYVGLPVTLSVVACKLHEMQAVARMSSCGSSSSSSSRAATCNQEIFARLAKAIGANARAFGEEEELAPGLHDDARLFARGRNWLRRKTHAALSASALHLPLPSSSSSTSSSSSAPAAPPLHDPSRIDGDGLPLPTGATLVQPWDSDWI